MSNTQDLHSFFLDNEAEDSQIIEESEQDLSVDKGEKVNPKIKKFNALIIHVRALMTFAMGSCHTNKKIIKAVEDIQSSVNLNLIGDMSTTVEDAVIDAASEQVVKDKELLGKFAHLEEILHQERPAKYKSPDGRKQRRIINLVQDLQEAA